MLQKDPSLCKALNISYRDSSDHPSYDFDNPATYLVVFDFVLPLSVSFGSFVYVGLQVRKFEGFSQDTRHQIEWKVTKTACISLGVFIGLFLPALLLPMLDPMPPNEKYPGLHIAADILACCEVFINPIIFMYAHQDYVKSLQMTMNELTRSIGMERQISVVSGTISMNTTETNL